VVGVWCARLVLDVSQKSRFLLDAHGWTRCSFIGVQFLPGVEVPVVPDPRLLLDKD